MTQLPTSDFEGVAETWRPGASSVTGSIEAGPTEKLAALLGVPTPEVLPPLWHEVHLRGAVGVDDLGVDGHPRVGPLIPPLTERRRMFGGATVQQIAPLRLGDRATRISRVTDVRVRQGRSGPLLLLTEEHLWSVGGQARLRERRDIVYRRAADVAASGVAPGDPDDNAGETLLADEPYVFAFSALTYNLHRIHYDGRYVREVEGHPALVVQGPLLALWCAERARRVVGSAPGLVTYRLTSAAYVGQPVTVVSAEADGAVVVEAMSQGRTCVHMTATP